MASRMGSNLARFLPPSFYVPAIGGFVFWGVLVNFRLFPLGLFFLNHVFGQFAAFSLGMLLARRFGVAWHEGSRRWAAAVGYVAVAIGVNCNVSFLYLMKSSYYPFPPPNYATLRIVLMGTGVLALAAIYAAMGGRAFSYLARSERRRRDLAWGAAGFGVGLYAGTATVAVSWIAGFFVAVGLLALVVPRSRAGVVAGLVLVAVAFGLHLRQPDLVYLGSLQDAKLEATTYSPYTVSQFYTFADRRCVALANGFHAVTYNCQDPDRLPRGLRYFFRALVGGRPSYRALVIGRSLGMYPNILLAINPNAQLIQTAEFDPHQARLVEQRFDPLTLLPQAQGKIRYFAGDLSRFVLAQREKYDVVFYNGIGLSQFQIPFSLPYQEQSLFTIKVLNHLFADVLDPHGAVVFDWGGRTLDEQSIIRATLPKGVFSAAFWYILNDPPFVGSPLTYVIASRDASLIAGVRDHLSRASFFKDITDATVVPSPMPWNRPMLRPQECHGQLIFVAAMLFLFAVGLVVFRFRPTFLIPTPAYARPWLAGVVTMCWFIDAAARHGRQLVGYGYAWPAMALAFFLAVAAGTLAPTRRWRRWSGKVALTLAAAAAIGVSVLDLTGPLASVSCILAGLLCGACWASAVAEGDHSALPAMIGGATIGFVLVLATFYFVGFDGGVYLGGLGAAILAWTLRMEGRTLART